MMVQVSHVQSTLSRQNLELLLHSSALMYQLRCLSMTGIGETSKLRGMTCSTVDISKHIYSLNSLLFDLSQRDERCRRTFEQ